MMLISAPIQLDIFGQKLPYHIKINFFLGRQFVL